MSRRGLSLIDQVLSGLSNFLAVAMVARALDATHFGAFVVGYALLTAVLSLVRARFGTQLSLAGDDAATVRLLGAVLGGVLVTAPVVVAIGFLLPLALTGAHTWQTLAVVALAMPLVCAQDVCRFAAVAVGRPGVAVTSDGLWTAAVLVGWLIGLSQLPALGLWAGAALVATVVAAGGLGVRPRLRAGWSALRQRHATGEALAVAAVVTQGASFAVLGAVTVVLATADAGALRGASTLMAPVNALLAFVPLALLPMVHRAPAHSHVRFCRWVAVGTSVAALAWGGILLLLPDTIGERVLGETWRGAAPLLTWTTLEYAALGALVAAQLGLSAREAAGDIMRVQFLYAGLLLLGGLAAVVAGRETWVVAAALALAAAAAAGTGWVVFVRATAGRRGETGTYAGKVPDRLRGLGGRR